MVITASWITSRDVHDDITTLKHVTPYAHRRAAEDIANREVCRDFDRFEPLFEQVRADIDMGLRDLREGIGFEDVDVGNFLILGGQVLYIATKGKPFKAPNKKDWDARLRVIFDNGTESNLLQRSVLRSAVDDDRHTQWTGNCTKICVNDANMQHEVLDLHSKS
jgi:hypothetical protein